MLTAPVAKQGVWGKYGGRSSLRVSLVRQRSACGKSLDCSGGSMQGAQSRGNGLPSFFACLTEYALPIGLHPAFHTLKTTIAMAPRALLLCQCAFYLCRRACCRRNSRAAIYTPRHCGRRHSYAPNRAKRVLANAYPCAAARRYHRMASALSCATPWPYSNM
jgi:hypothetical protein